MASDMLEREEKLDVSYETPGVLNYVIEEVEKMIQVAQEDYGCVYGGYVRDVVINREMGEEIQAFKDVDIWFYSLIRAANFLYKMNGKLEIIEILDRRIPKTIYGFDRIRCYFVDNGRKIAFVDLIVTPSPPVNDYRINRLMYKGRPLNFKGPKVTDIMRGYMLFLSRTCDEKRKIHKERFEKLLTRGWKIRYNGEVVVSWDDIMSIAGERRIMYN